MDKAKEVCFKREGALRDRSISNIAILRVRKLEPESSFHLSRGSSNTSFKYEENELKFHHYDLNLSTSLIDAQIFYSGNVELTCWFGNKDLNEECLWLQK